MKFLSEPRFNRPFGFLCLLWAALIFQIAFAEPPNLADVKNQVIVYYESGAYQKEVSHVVSQARGYLKERILTNKLLAQPKKLAIVLDVDETSLSNFGNLKVLNFGCTIDEIIKQAAKGKNVAIAPTLNLYRYAKQHGVAIFFITGRKLPMREITEKNLRSAGYYDWSGLIMKPENYAEKSSQKFKIQARKELTDKGYDIVLNIGDQLSDLSGGYADRVFKLPNPFYLIP